MNKKLQWSLFSLRITCFIVMLMWTLDKFINPQHASHVYEKFYLIGGLGHNAMYVIGGLEAALILAFVFGLFKRFSYGGVFFLHLISTVSSYKQYMDPFAGTHLLFFAALPMLAALWTIYLHRNEDKLFTLNF